MSKPYIEELEKIEQITTEDFSSSKTNAVTNITRAKVTSYKKIHHIDIVCNISASNTTLFQTSLRPEHAIELNCVSGTNTTCRCFIDAEGKITIANIGSTENASVFINGIVIC